METYWIVKAGSADSSAQIRPGRVILWEQHEAIEITR